jgi:hydrogenase maturation protein HypF
MVLLAYPTDSETAAPRRLRLLVRGAVQGVGFRPFVYRQAQALKLSGWVENSPQGLTLEVEGDPVCIDALVRAIREAPPPNAAVASIEAQEIGRCGGETFRIRASAVSGARTGELLPDLATCNDCLRELFDPADRRYLYPFINCTQCGPRYSIIEDIPYDRTRTSMRHFPMCSACRAEYEDPMDRRFHAEPIACRDCGPRLALWTAAGEVAARDHDAVLAAAAAVRKGQIIALKGIGGFHLIADARSEGAIQYLRLRKQREEKPFAVMFPSLTELHGSCAPSPAEEALLTSPARPIVLMRRKGSPIASAVAPANPWLGALLPYTPLHHLLMRAFGFPVVATSGNISDEPIVTGEKEALDRLAGIAGLFLVHDRPIVRPVEDSVVRVVCARELVLRRGRGYAPASVSMKGAPAGILAMGGHLKTAIALTAADRTIMSAHIGDLETAAARKVHAQAVADTVRLQGAEPRAAVRDLHPDYASSHAAEAMGLPVIAVQHHLAHVAACMAEHGLRPPVLGVAWDGAGYGPDGTVWGGEFLLITNTGWRRVAHLRYFRVPGGEAAAREPRRAALGLLYEAFGEEAFAMTALGPVAAFTPAERRVLHTQLARKVNAPLTSSAGRLFDAFAALCGLRQRAGYEGQAAAALEWAAEGWVSHRCYEFALRESEKDCPLVVDWQPALEACLADLRAGRDAGEVSAAFHAGLVAAITAVAHRIGERRVVLTGGCFQNARLTGAAVATLSAAGYAPAWHQRIPPNDGGIALGQAAWAAWSGQGGETACA